MSQQELLVFAASLLDQLNIPYFVTGSWSSSLQGEPRATHDIDLVVTIEKHQIKNLVAAFSSDRFYISEVAISDAIKNKSMFNVLDIQSGDKIDFWMLTDELWDQTRFKRREERTLFGRKVFVSTAEDTILGKLRWAKLSGGSEKQMSDAKGIYEVQGDRLDVPYIETWVQHLGLQIQWQKLTQKNDPVLND